METTYGVLEAPKDLVLGKDETIEWVVTYKGQNDFRENTFLIHAETSERASEGVEKMFPGSRILKVEYYGTYQY